MLRPKWAGLMWVLKGSKLADSKAVREAEVPQRFAAVALQKPSRLSSMHKGAQM